MPTIRKSSLAPVAIIGGGYSGTMLAVRLAERGLASVLIDPSARPGRGVAYGTGEDCHLLNVRSARMSARAGDPDHFVRWLQIHAPELADPDGFAPRRLFGTYIEHQLARAPAGRITHVRGTASAISPDGISVGDQHIDADHVVLATGNPTPDGAGAAPDVRVIVDPWAPGALDNIQPADKVFLLGTGLTMIDMVLALSQRGWRGAALAVSRRGLLPRPHDDAQPEVQPGAPADGHLSARLRQARARAGQIGWGTMMDELRPLNADLWRGLSAAQRARFLRHLRPWWDVHRHRIAPAIWERFGRADVRVASGRLVSIEVDNDAPNDAGLAIRWRPRGEAAGTLWRGQWMIDCTGPGFDPARSSDPLVRSLIERGLARPAPLGLGLDVTPEGAVIGADGIASARLWALGPPARAALWETVAVPDIRERIEALVETLAETPVSAS